MDKLVEALLGHQSCVQTVSSGRGGGLTTGAVLFHL